MNELALSPTLDGIDHVRIHPRAKTLLGRLLANEAHTPFIHPKHGSFESLEAFYLWYGSRQGKEHERIKDLFGPVAKAYVNRIERVTRADFSDAMSEALRLKLKQNPRITDALFSMPALPFLRYETDEDGDMDTVYRNNDWFFTTLQNEIARLRSTLKESAS